ncbi:MAG: phosphatidylserine/phosphatidylglycerophosphate/cardiolipin synthase family protein [Deltaproteobacteria bacterium]|nr:phosphatidylserine/phosphatidylglycerophosphate/cardiolipin synthase family protein [Deltaproteobacteria bacterium]
MIIFSCFLVAIVFAVVQFIFNPLGLGPEPDTVLPDDFFSKPGKDVVELKLLVDGKAAFDEILRAIDTAQSSIHVQTYIWKDDHIGRQVVTKLKTAANRGVKVTVRKDALGTAFELLDMLKGRPSPVFTKSGLKDDKNIDVNVDVFTDTDHSKYFIVDHKEVIFGGMNIADEYHTQWHDYMAMIQSERWTRAFEGKVLKGSSWPNPAPFVITLNDRNTTEIRTALIEMINNAKESVIIEHAYFSDDKVIEAVKLVAERGIQVNIILPKRPDTHHYANMVTINKLIQEGNTAPRVFLYPQMMHAKAVLTDGVIAAIGSANLTPRSMKTSREVTMFVHCKAGDPFIKRLHEQMEADMAESEEVITPFKLGTSGKIKALFGKYLW